VPTGEIALMPPEARLHEAPVALKVGGVFLAVCAIAFVFALFDAVTGGQLWADLMAKHHIPADVVNRTVSNFVSFSWLYGWLGTIYAILHTNAAMKDRELQLVEARSLAQTAQLTALRLQLNPHFLFNTLNAVSSLVESDPRGVRRMISRLGDLLRHTLEETNEREITLDRELDLLRRYLDIMEVRFQGALDVQVKSDPSLSSALVPNMILQPMVENAFKHGLSETPSGGRVEISARRLGDELILEVKDNGPGVREQGTGNGEQGIGVQNTRDRLHALYGDRYRFSLRNRDDGVTGAVAELALPYHTEVFAHG